MILMYFQFLVKSIFAKWVFIIKVCTLYIELLSCFSLVLSICLCLESFEVALILQKSPLAVEAIPSGNLVTFHLSAFALHDTLAADETLNRIH